MPGPDDLYDLAGEYLAACAAAVATTDAGAIGRVYVSGGMPALDCCPQLTVHSAGPDEAGTVPLLPPLSPASRTGKQGALFLVQLTATVVRCSPVPDERGDPPTALELDAVAKATMADVWAIWNFVRSRYRDGSLFASPSGQRELLFDPAFAMNTSGGCAGWQVPIRVELGGYEA